MCMLWVDHFYEKKPLMVEIKTNLFSAYGLLIHIVDPISCQYLIVQLIEKRPKYRLFPVRVRPHFLDVIYRWQHNF